MTRWVLMILLLLTSTIHATETCTVTSQVCLQGPEERRIQTALIYRDCWQWQEEVTCTSGESVDHCTTLAQETGCSLEATECLSMNASGTCETTQNTYACDHEVADLPDENTALDVRVTIDATFEKEKACASFIEASCIEASHVCSVPSATETIEGVAVTLSCWEEVYTYTCEHTAQSLACDLLGSAQCTFEALIEKTAETTTNTYRCAIPSAVAAHADITFLERVTVTDGYETDASNCEAFEANGTCSLTGSICQTAFPVAPSVCQEESRVYSCSGELDTSVCEPLVQLGCVADTLHCEQNQGTSCLVATQDFTCEGALSAPLPDTIEERSRETVIDAITAVTDCPSFSTTAALRSVARTTGCTEVSRLCTESGGTKIVNGESVTKDCWNYEITYECSGSSETVNGCEPWETNETCELISEECIAADGSTCTYTTRTYRCKESDDQVLTQEQCTESICAYGFCQRQDDPANTNLYDSILKLEVARQAAVYGDYQDLHFFSGELNTCENKEGHSCCAGRVKGNQTNQAGLGALYVFGMDAATEAIKTVGSPYVYDVLASHETLEPLMNALYADAANGAYSPSLSYYGLTVSYGANGLAFSFNPYVFFATIALEVATDYLSCTPDEQALQLKRGQDLCVYIGSVCTHYHLGSCLIKEERHCCYNSRLARIVQEAAHDQLGLTWGTTERPNCAGLTHAEFLAIDFSRIDLSECLSDIADQRLADIHVERTTLQTAQRIDTLKNTDDKYPVPEAHHTVCTEGNCPTTGVTP